MENKKLRILAIHGYGQSDTIFYSRLGSWRKGLKKVEFVFLRAPHNVPMKINFGIDDSQEGYGWWFNTEDHQFRATVPSESCVGFEDSVASVEKIFQESGPFDGILGFSQGAAFAAILCAMQQRKLLQAAFNFAIIISGFKSLCAPHAKYYDEKVDIPSFHIYGETDQIVPTEMAEKLSELFVNKKVIKHEGGHYIPSKKEIYQDFIMEMLLNKNNC